MQLHTQHQHYETSSNDNSLAQKRLAHSSIKHTHKNALKAKQ